MIYLIIYLAVSSDSYERKALFYYTKPNNTRLRGNTGDTLPAYFNFFVPFPRKARKEKLIPSSSMEKGLGNDTGYPFCNLLGYRIIPVATGYLLPDSPWIERNL